MRVGERVKNPASHDFYGRPIESLVPLELPDTTGIPVNTGIPHPGDHIRCVHGQEGVVLTVGPMAVMGERNKSIRVDFGNGERWWIARNAIEDYWTP